MADTGRTPAARVAAGWSVWTKSFGQAGRTASDAATGAAGTASSLYGVAAGADRLISPDTLIGFALAGGGTAYGLGTRGTGSGDFAQVGLYGSTRLGPGYVSAALAYGWNRFDVSRTAGLSPLETYRSAPTVHTFGGRIEAGRRFGDRAFATTPYAAVEAIGASTGGYRESWGPGNTGIFALTYGARTYATARAEAGVRLDSSAPSPRAPISSPSPASPMASRPARSAVPRPRSSRLRRPASRCSAPAPPPTRPSARSASSCALPPARASPPPSTASSATATARSAPMPASATAGEAATRARSRRRAQIRTMPG